MRTEYILTVAQQAELADIERQLAQLYMRRADIYMHAQTRYIPETPEENESDIYVNKILSYGLLEPDLNKVFGDIILNSQDKG